MVIQTRPKQAPTPTLFVERPRPIIDLGSPNNAEIVRKPGRPASGKIVVTLRLDPDVVAKFKATGKGWQARINDALAKAIIPPD